MLLLLWVCLGDFDVVDCDVGLVGSALGWVGIWWFGVVIVFCLFVGCCNIEALQFGVFWVA